MIGCPNPECKLWMHEECLIDDACQRKYNEEHGEEQPKKKGPRKSGTKKPELWRKYFKAELQGTELEAENTKFKIQITRLEKDGSVLPTSQTWTEELRCLKCEHWID